VNLRFPKQLERFASGSHLTAGLRRNHPSNAGRLGNLLPAFARLAQDRGAPALQPATSSFYRRARFYEERERRREELNGRMLACQILITGLIARVANDQRDPLRFLTDFRDEIKAVVSGINISGMENTERVRSLRARSMNCSR
jgi:hypothetical protein